MIALCPLPEPGSSAYSDLLLRPAAPPDVEPQVAALLEQVRLGGDVAVRDLTLRFDRVALAWSRIDSDRIEAAFQSAPGELVEALETAADHIARVHTAQRFHEETVEVVPGVDVWRVWRPLHRVGIYVPGGRAAYPSSVLMMAVPARMAGCREVVICSPPGPDGQVAASVMAAARVAGVSELHAVGGVQAIGAMAFGTETLGRVDKIFGPGNVYVTAAKRQVFGRVAVDMPAGPSEVIVIADDSAPADRVRADLIAQAEHAPDALGILVTTDPELGLRVGASLSEEAGRQIRILNTDSAEAALGFANDFAPEHVVLALRDAARWLPYVEHAGSVFLGAGTPPALSDYATGANHVLPTGGSARSFGALGLGEFGRRMQVQAATPSGLAQLAPTVRALATSEGLPQHWNSVAVRLEEPAESKRSAPRPRASVLGLSPYQWEQSTQEVARTAQIDAGQVVRFDMNSSPWAGAGLASVGAIPINEYPDSTYATLTAALARYTGASADGITVGAGADELLDLVAKAFIGPGDPVLVTEPSYAMHRVLSEQVGGDVHRVEAQNWLLDRNTYLRWAARSRVTWICNPNNPTGELLPIEFIAELARTSAGLLVVDEAYYEFTGISVAPLIRELPNLVVVRTLSKAFGLAGARVGYSLSGRTVAISLAAVRPPGSVSSIAAALAVLALEDADQMRTRVALLGTLQARLVSDLRGLGLDVRETPTNFVLVATPPDLVSAWAASGLVVRGFPAASAMAGWSRVTVRAADEAARLVDATRQWGESDAC